MFDYIREKGRFSIADLAKGVSFSEYFKNTFDKKIPKDNIGMSISQQGIDFLKSAEGGLYPRLYDTENPKAMVKFTKEKLPLKNEIPNLTAD